jgi:hypothetical protein
MAGIMAGTQRTGNPNNSTAASSFAAFRFLLGLALLFIFGVHDAGAQYLPVPPSGTEAQRAQSLPSPGQNFMILPSLSVGEEYNDNVYLTRYNKVYDYITIATPAFMLDYTTSFWTWHLDTFYTYRYYARGTKTGDYSYFANLANHTELINKFFYIDLRDLYDKTSLSTVKDYTTQSSFVGQTDQNIFTVNPYFVFKSESRFTPVLGYQYVNTWYKQSTGISTVDNIGYAEMVTDLSTNVTFTAGMRYTADQNDVVDYNKADVYAGPKYTYAPHSYVYCLIGETFLGFHPQVINPGNILYQGDTHHVIWDAGFSHRYSTSTLSYEMKSDYIHDPELILRRVDSFVGTYAKQTPRTTYTVSAGLFEYRNPSTNHLQDTTDQLTLELTHALSPRDTLVLSESIQRFENNQVNTVTSLWESLVRFERKLLKDLTLALTYSYTNSYSHNSYYDNYVNNRFDVALTKTF